MRSMRACRQTPTADIRSNRIRPKNPAKRCRRQSTTPKLALGHPKRHPLPSMERRRSRKKIVSKLSAHFRSHVIAAEMTDWEPHRSILRDAMIETFVRQKFCDPDEWFEKVPGYLRQGTNPAEKGRYLDRICEIVSRLDRSTTKTGARSSRSRAAPRTQGRFKQGCRSVLARSPTRQ